MPRNKPNPQSQTPPEGGADSLLVEPYITQGESGTSTDFGAILAVPPHLSPHPTHFLPPQRMAAYRQFLKLSNDAEIARAYEWNYALAACIWPLLGCLEVMLRDAIHRAMQRHVSDTPTSLRFAWYDPEHSPHYALSGRTLEDVKRALASSHKHPHPRPDDVISKLTFGFWVQLMRILQPTEAPKIIPLVFPHHSLEQRKKWGSPVQRNQLNTTLRTANDLRNRLAHHEPLFKFSHQGHYPKNLDQGLLQLQGCLSECLSVCAWIAQGAQQALIQCAWYQRFVALSKPETFDAWVRNNRPLPQALPQLQPLAASTSSS